MAVTEQELLARLDSLYCYGVLHLKEYENDHYLIEKDNWTKLAMNYIKDINNFVL